MRSSATAFLVRLALVGALLVTWALGIGRYGGADEPAHVLRAYAAAHGDVLGDAAPSLAPGYRIVSVPSPLGSGDPACYRHDARLTSECAAAVPGTDEVRVATSAGLTPPLYHMVVGWIVRLAGDESDTAWYRVAAALLHAVVVALALTRLRNRPQSLALVVASVTPAAWFLFGVVNPNSLEIALALLGWVGVARFIDTVEPTRADALWVAVPIAIAIIVRPIAVVVAGAVAVTLMLRGRTAGRRRELVMPVATAIAASVAWSLLVDIQIDDARTAVHRSILASIGDSLGSLHITATEAVGSLGWNEFRAPLLATTAWALLWLAALAVMIGARRTLDRPAWWAAATWAGLLVATPVVFEVALAGSVGPIWQGRYSLPLLLGLPVLVYVPMRQRAVTGVLVVAALIEVTTYWATVRRYAVGSNGPWSLDGAYRSSAALSPRAWLVVHLTVVALALALAVRTVARARLEDQPCS